MPFGEVRLIPGVNTERTPTLNEAGISQSNLIRFKDSLAQKYGGWTTFYPFALTGVPRELHAWEDLNQNTHLGIGTTNSLSIITNGAIVSVTPQIFTSDVVPSFTTAAGSTAVTIADSNINNVTVNDSVYFNTPVAVGGLVLSGLYPIQSIVGGSSYTITALTPAISSATTTGFVPLFTTTSGSPTIGVTLATSNLTTGNSIVFPIPTTIASATIVGDETVTAGVNANSFQITASVQANANATAYMNHGNAELVYYLNLGPPAAGQGYGLGLYGAGGYGAGIPPAVQTGTPITAIDWTSDNWGEILLACPSGKGVFQYDPTGGFTTAGIVASAPPFNGGIFVSTTQQILVCWASTTGRTVGVQQDPMLVKWSDSGDYTSFIPTTTNQAGSFRIPFGSMIMGGMAVQNQNLIWTDLDLWAMNYQGVPFIFGFNMIGAGAGLISSHAAQKLRGNVYWMGRTNFYAYTSGGVAVLPCSVWDFVFQNINMTYASNVRAMPNTPFNEAGWLFPSSASVNGECDSYVKMNITEPGAPWDYGPANSLPRSAWIDQTILGMPISAQSNGFIYQQETTNNANGAPLNWSFQTGYFYIGEGEEFAFVDQIYPDFKYGQYGGSQGAEVSITPYTINYMGDTPIAWGPYTADASTSVITTRIRGRQMAFLFQGSDTNSFVRIGKVRYRWQGTGRQ